MGADARALLGVVLLLTLPTWPADAVRTANSDRPDLLPTDCGRRLVRPDEAVRPFIVGSGNTTAYYGQYPWQARLVMYDANARGYVHHCGGIVISQEHVVTAAHCVVAVVPSQLLVRVGDLRFDGRERFEQEFAVASFHAHSQFGTGPGLRHDVALLRLRRRAGPGIEFGRYVQPACLPAADAEYETFLPCEVSGWGRTSDGAPISEVLRGVSVPLVSDFFCGAPEVYQDRFLPGAMFCSGPTGGGADSCEGDSGGPLVCGDADSGRFVAYGVVSSGDPLGCGRRPGLYTKLSAYVDWLLPRLQLDQEEDAASSTPVASAPHLADRPLGDLNQTCLTPDGAAGLCLHLKDCPKLLQTHVGNRSDLLARPLCGLDAASTPLICCPGRGCGRTSFSPPEYPGAALAKDATELPWIVTLSKMVTRDGYATFCAGVVISDQWVLTSATCATTSDLKVRFGSPDIPSTASFSLNVVEAVRHTEYLGWENSAQDIMLMKTESKISFSSIVNPICLPDASLLSTVVAGKHLLYAGWSRPLVKWARTKVIDFNVCGSVVEFSRYLYGRGLFCTKWTDLDFLSVKLDCASDLRGSVAMDIVNENGIETWHVVGLSISGLGCSDQSVPSAGIFISLEPHLDWIRSVISEAS
ncbi:transmembrane protease serine 9-like [Pollicipes pollicipes]|uniref:transmembrane protease serine 9-like n=1 Tax=Pollicipes pollicipes TaxID=41117 RepID=UPI001884AAAE|nr:transmembrane protease serine 9-like [Pollicipes pollicipes]